ncbi:MAG TPA: hypothetical protein VH599_08610 [Ktedonobacterales bacterium]|jgi:hypothetical protein
MQATTAHYSGDEPLPGAAMMTIEPPLSIVRYGIAKELRLYHDRLVAIAYEEGEETAYYFDAIKRLVLMPGEHIPSKLMLMLDLTDGNTIIVAEGMSNVKDFRKLLARLTEVQPDIELDPPDMDEQLRQALEIRRRSNYGCYGLVLATFLATMAVIWLLYLIVSFINGIHH